MKHCWFLLSTLILFFEIVTKNCKKWSRRKQHIIIPHTVPTVNASGKYETLLLPPCSCLNFVRLKKLFQLFLGGKKPLDRLLATVWLSLSELPLMFWRSVAPLQNALLALGDKAQCLLAHWYGFWQILPHMKLFGRIYIYKKYIYFIAFTPEFFIYINMLVWFFAMTPYALK